MSYDYCPAPDEARDAYINDQSSCVGDCAEGCDHAGHCAECGRGLHQDEDFCLDCQIRFRASHQIGCAKQILSGELLDAFSGSTTGASNAAPAQKLRPNEQGDMVEDHSGNYGEQCVVCRGNSWECEHFEELYD